MATAGDLINGALRLLGVIAEGETPSSETSQDALTAFNQMIDSWNTERLAVYATQEQVFTWAAATASRTIGPSGNFVGNRPIDVLESTYFKDTASGVSYPIALISQDQYNDIAVKTTSGYPYAMWVNMTNPNATMTVYPVPSVSLSFYIVSTVEISQPALLSTDIALPPGYLRALRYNLATELAPEFGMEPSLQVQRIAMASKRNLKRINNPDDVMSLPYDILGNRYGYNIRGGY